MMMIAVLYAFTFSIWVNCAPFIHINDQAARTIGQQIWHNECRGSYEGLTSWNDGEEFASLGIGHFIWYPANNAKGVFQESFPSLLTFLEEHHQQLPDWLQKHKTTGCPWLTRQEFIDAFDSPHMQQLRTLLANTVELQIAFIVERFHIFLDAVKKKYHDSEYQDIKDKLLRMSRSANGVYALIDYINFKGEGFNTHEHYNQKGWGLLHVLTKMNNTEEDPVKAFVDAAKKVLKERVAHAPVNRDEQRWIPGWFKRIETYATIQFV